jgi:hypothetical protein
MYLDGLTFLRGEMSDVGYSYLTGRDLAHPVWREMPRMMLVERDAELMYSLTNLRGLVL